MKLLSPVLIFLFCQLVSAQLQDGWQELMHNRYSAARALFEQAKYTETDPNLPRIGWFLTFTGKGPTPELVQAALSILKEDAEAPSAEFVLEWMKPFKEHFETWVADAGQVLTSSHPSNPELKVLYANLLRQWATYQGNRDLYKAALDRSGFITHWKFSELFGGYPIPDFHKTWPAENAEYWNGATLQVSRSGVLMPPNDRPGKGVLWVYSEFDNPIDQELFFRIFSYQNISVFVDGNQLASYRHLEEIGPSIRTVATTLPKGRHEILVKITQSRNLNGQFSLQLTGTAPVSFPSPDNPSCSVTGQSMPARATKTGLESKIQNRNDDMSAYVRAYLAIRNHDFELALDILEDVYSRHSQSQIVGGLLADTYIENVGFLPAELQYSRAFEILQNLDLKHPHALENSLRLARLADKARAIEQLLVILDEVIEKNPQYCDALSFKLEVASRQNLIEAREGVLNQLDALGTEHRWAQRLKLKVAQADGNLDEIKKILDVLSSLQPWGWYGAELYEINGDFAAAAEDLKIRWEIFPDNDYFPYAISQAYAKMDDRENQRKFLAETLKLNPIHRQAVLDLVNLDCLAGDMEAATARLQSYLTLEPVDADFRQILSHLQGATAFESFRVNTDEIIEKAKSRPAPEGADSELLLDQLMVRLFPDGSQMRYTHLITRVLTKEAVDRESELNLPGNLEILELRTIKPDGSVYYPENIAHKSSISLSAIGVGDFIDEEHIEYLPPAYYDKDGLDAAMSFIFQGIDRIYHHSELVLIYPEDLDPEPVILQRNFPEEVSRTQKDGLVYIRWLTQDMAPLYPEPAMPSPNAVLPAATFYYNTDWYEVRDFFTNAIRSRMGLSASLLKEIESWAEETDDRLSLARSIYRRLADQIEGDGQFYKNVNLVWETKTGNATMLLAKCYEVLGIPCDLIFTRPAQFIDSNFRIPFPEMFSYVLLRIEIDGQPIWLDANRKHLPFGYIPFAYRGADGLILNKKAPTPLVEIPDFDDQSENVESYYVMTFSKDGSVEGEGLERFHGSFAAQMVDSYSAMNQVEVRQNVEAGLNTNYPGASISKVTITEDLPPGIFELISLFSHPNLARTESSGLSVSQLLPENPLQHQYASLPSRNFPVRIRQPHINEATIELHVSDEFAWAEAPKPFHLKTPFGEYAFEVTIENPQVLTLRRRYHLPAQLIDPAQYSEFQQFCEAMIAQESLVFHARSVHDD